jgi:hypothetical protein
MVSDDVHGASRTTQTDMISAIGRSAGEGMVFLFDLEVGAGAAEFPDQLVIFFRFETAGGIDDHSARPDAGEGLLEEFLLAAGEGFQVPAVPAPTGFSSAV